MLFRPCKMTTIRQRNLTLVGGILLLMHCGVPSQSADNNPVDTRGANAAMARQYASAQPLDSFHIEGSGLEHGVYQLDADAASIDLSINAEGLSVAAQQVILGLYALPHRPTDAPVSSVFCTAKADSTLHDCSMPLPAMLQAASENTTEGQSVEIAPSALGQVFELSALIITDEPKAFITRQPIAFVDPARGIDGATDLGFSFTTNSSGQAVIPSLQETFSLPMRLSGRLSASQVDAAAHLTGNERRSIQLTLEEKDDTEHPELGNGACVAPSSDADSTCEVRIAESGRHTTIEGRLSQLQNMRVVPTYRIGSFTLRLQSIEQDVTIGSNWGYISFDDDVEATIKGRAPLDTMFVSITFKDMAANSELMIVPFIQVDGERIKDLPETFWGELVVSPNGAYTQWSLNVKDAMIRYMKATAANYITESDAYINLEVLQTASSGETHTWTYTLNTRRSFRIDD